MFTRYVGTATDKKNIEFIITYDRDDYHMTEAVINKAVSLHHNIKAFKGTSVGKIHACNRDIEYAQDWDIIVLASDDMIPNCIGWDDIIRNSMTQNYPDLDGVLYFPDGYTALNTMCIMGRKYYNRFGYIYNPDYISLWADNEFMEVADNLKKQKKFTQILFKHEHPANKNGAGNDSLYVQNDKYYSNDRITYMERKQKNFYL